MKIQKLTTERLLRGLGLTDEQIEEMRRRLRASDDVKQRPKPRDKMRRAGRDK